MEVLRILPIADESPDAVDLPLGLFGLRLAVRQVAAGVPGAPAPSPRLLQPLLETPLASARLEVLHVAEDQRARARRAFAPARSRDVDLAGAAHAVLVEECPDGVARSAPPATVTSSSRKPSSSTSAAGRPRPADAGRIASATSRSARPISDVTLCGTDCASVSATFFSPSHASSFSLSHHVASIARHERRMASRIEAGSASAPGCPPG